MPFIVVTRAIIVRTVQPTNVSSISFTVSKWHFWYDECYNNSDNRESSNSSLTWTSTSINLSSSKFITFNPTVLPNKNCCHYISKQISSTICERTNNAITNHYSNSFASSTGAAIVNVDFDVDVHILPTTASKQSNRFLWGVSNITTTLTPSRDDCVVLWFS